MVHGICIADRATPIHPTARATRQVASPLALDSFLKRREHALLLTGGDRLLQPPSPTGLRPCRERAGSSFRRNQYRARGLKPGIHLSPSSSWPRTAASHVANSGSNPDGDASVP
jgi:hypothetical protein